jgi:predicted 2-oxoglutarate/Fe(II)-dependent dioxygenase YbiX
MVSYVEKLTGVFSVQLYDSAACDSIIKYAEDADDWSPAIVGEEHTGEYQSSVRREYRAAETFSPPYRSKMRREFDWKVNSLIKPLVKQVWRSDLKEHSGTHIVRYSPGGFYVVHADAGLDVNDRYFTVLCYLNEDFQGGQTSFPLLDFSITPQKGSAVIFPATYLHRGEPVVSGRKYILVSWLTGDAPIQFI